MQEQPSPFVCATCGNRYVVSSMASFCQIKHDRA
jgi:hypothetical protein